MTGHEGKPTRLGGRGGTLRPGGRGGALRAVIAAAGLSIPRLLWAIVLGSITLLSAMTLTVLSGWLITRAWQMPPVLELSVAITAVRALGISRAVFRYIDRLASHNLALGSLATLRVALFQALAFGKYTATAKKDVLNSHLSADCDRISDFIVRVLVPAGVAAVTSIIAVVATCTLHPAAGVVLVVCFLFTGIVVPVLVARASRDHEDIAADDELAALMNTVLVHRAEYAAAGMLETQKQAVQESSSRSNRAVVRAHKPLATAQFISELANAVAIIAAVAIGTWAYPGSATWLGMLAFLPMAAFESHAALPAAGRQWAKSSAAAARIAPVLSTRRGSGNTTAHNAAKAGQDAPAKDVLEEEPQLEIRGVRCQFGDTDWDFIVPFGHRKLIQGPSGIGKTTLLETIAGLLPTTAGTVLVGNTAIRDYDEPTQRALVSYHSEDAWIFRASIKENLAVANPTASEALYDEVLRAVGLMGWVQGLDGGIDHELADGANSLSAGQRRRLLLARALISPAPILCLDEPTEHIAHDDAQQLLALLLDATAELPGARAKRTIVVVSHDATAA